MKALPFELQKPFFKLLLEKGSLSEFEIWLYNEPSLEKYLTPDDYLALISLDFKDKKSIVDIEKLSHPYLDHVAYYHHRLLNHLSSLMINPNDGNAHSDIFYWYVGGYRFLSHLMMAMTYLKDISCGDEDYEVFCVMDFNRGIREVKQQASWLYDDFINGKLVLLAPPHTSAVSYQDFRDDLEKARMDLSD